MVSLLLIGAFPLTAAVLAQNPQQSSSPPSQPSQLSTEPPRPTANLQVFSGKIIELEGKFVLQDPATKDTNPPFGLDDQQLAKKYKNKSVVVRGTLDSASNTIHVAKITQG